MLGSGLYNGEEAMAFGRTLGLAAAALLVAQPCLAAEDLGDAGPMQRKSAAFGGFTIRVPIGKAGAARPSARLQLTTSHSVWDGRYGSPVRTVRPPGLELGIGEAGRPSLHIGGRSAAEVERKLQLGASTGTTLLIVGGVAVAAIVLIAVASSPSPGPRRGDFD